MSYLAGIDIGNSTTEVAIADITENQCLFIGSGIAATTGLKGTIENIPGVIISLENALKSAILSIKNLDLILINDAAPVIGDVAMETISETIILESSMVGHNPDTPGGQGLCAGVTIMLEDLERTGVTGKRDYVAIISSHWDFEEAACVMNTAMQNGFRLKGAIVQKDDAVLISNRVAIKIPIIDEVKYIDRIPIGVECAVEVAKPGYCISTLSNPFGLATLFRLTASETRAIAPTAKVLSGKRSAVVLRTCQGKVIEQKIPSGRIEFIGAHKNEFVGVDEGARRIMDAQKKAGTIKDIKGEYKTNVGKMFENIRQTLASLTDKPSESITLKDLMAADTIVYRVVEGGIADELSKENAVGLAALVKAEQLQMQKVARELESETGCKVAIEGVEAEMALKGALTTPGVTKPMAVLDIGAGSTDAAYVDDNGEIKFAHAAGAGDLVTMLINSELALNDKSLAEDIKKNPLAKVESLSQIRHEDGSLQFMDEMLEPKFFGRNVIMKSNTMILVPSEASIETIQRIRRNAKKKVFRVNALRVLEKIFSKQNVNHLECVILVGGSALDFEIPNMLTDVFVKYGIIAGQANVRGTEGPRNAVATGLLIAHLETNKEEGT
jgi:diol dehydratase reactivase alpha subunit